MPGGREVEATETGEAPGCERMSQKTLLHVCVSVLQCNACNLLSVLYSSSVAGK